MVSNPNITHIPHSDRVQGIDALRPRFSKMHCEYCKNSGQNSKVA
jgi:hypothetical protein